MDWPSLPVRRALQVALPQNLPRIAYVRGRINRTCPYNRQRTSAPLDQTSACTMRSPGGGGDNLLQTMVNRGAVVVFPEIDRRLFRVIEAVIQEQLLAFLDGA